MACRCDDYSCAAQCELLAEIEKERDTWVLAYRITAEALGLPIRLVDPEYGATLHAKAELILPCMAAAYAIAEAYGDNWRLELEAKPLEDI